MENYLLGDVFEQDSYSITYEAYDKKKKCWCYLTIPTVKTSWNYSVNY